MNGLLNFYQYLPERLDPVALAVGPIGVRWYSLAYIVAFGVVYCLLNYRRQKGEATYTADQIFDFILYAFLGVLIGGRVGYVLFYNLPFFWQNPWAVIWPFDATGQFIGFYGMSYHGGLVGVALASWLFVRQQKINFFAWADFVVPAVSAGFLFGRLGNFLNGELYGRITTVPWGMYFPNDALGQLRHPSQLYEAGIEGLVLFLLFWLARNNPKFQGYFLGLYLLGYGATRFFLEFFRQPDPQIGLISNFFTFGQILSVIMVVVAVFLLAFQERKKNI